MVNIDCIPDYLKVVKIILLSKKNQSAVKLDNIRPIMALPHVTKLIEKMIKNKLEDLDSNLLQVGSYQSGFI